MRLHRVVGGLLLGTLASTPVFAGDDHYQELLSTYHELAALRESLDQTALITGAMGPQGLQGAAGDAGPAGESGNEGPAGGSSLSDTDRNYITDKLDQLFLEVAKSEQWVDDVSPYAQKVQARATAAWQLSIDLNAAVDTLESEGAE